MRVVGVQKNRVVELLTHALYDGGTVRTPMNSRSPSDTPMRSGKLSARAAAKIPLSAANSEISEVADRHMARIGVGKTSRKVFIFVCVISPSADTASAPFLRSALSADFFKSPVCAPKYLHDVHRFDRCPAERLLDGQAVHERAQKSGRKRVARARARDRRLRVRIRRHKTSCSGRPTHTRPSDRP